MTRKVISSLLGLGALLCASSSIAATAPDVPVAMPIQVAGAALGSETSLPLVQPQAKLGVSGAFQPAPMPDPDVDPPSGGGSARGASLTPAIFSHKEEFAGDGFAAASDADHGLDHRRAPAAGLNWSVPVK